VWKVGSSLSGFFNVGGLPRQGAIGGTGPFKRIPFARLEDGELAHYHGRYGSADCASRTAELHKRSQRRSCVVAWT
jgi:hypothetical protein